MKVHIKPNVKTEGEIVGGVHKGCYDLKQALGLYGEGVVVLDEEDRADIIHCSATEDAERIDIYTNQGIHTFDDWGSTRDGENAQIIKSASKAAAAIFPSHWLCDYFYREIKLNNVFYLKNSIFVDDFIPEYPGYRRKGAMVLYTGGWNNYKNPEIVIALAKRFPNVSFICTCYDGPDYTVRPGGSIDFHSPSTGCVDNVEFIGRIPSEDMMQLYHDCAFTIFTAFNEAGSYSALEALASGKPILTPRSGCFVDYVVEGVNGFMFNRGPYLDKTVDNMIPSVTELLRRDDRYVKCRHSVLSYDWKYHIPQLLYLYDYAYRMRVENGD